MNSLYDHQITHIATMISMLRHSDETSQQLVSRILSDNDLLVQTQRLVSTEYTIDFIRAILLNPEFQNLLDKMNIRRG